MSPRVVPTNDCDVVAKMDSRTDPTYQNRNSSHFFYIIIVASVLVVLLSATQHRTIEMELSEIIKS